MYSDSAIGFLFFLSRFIKALFPLVLAVLNLQMTQNHIKCCELCK